MICVDRFGKYSGFFPNKILLLLFFYLQCLIRFEPKIEKQFLDAISKYSVKKSDGLELIRLFLEDDTEFRCDTDFKHLIYCVLFSGGYLYKNGTINVETSASRFPNKKIMEKVFIRCSNLLKNSSDDSAYCTFECYKQYTPYSIQLCPIKT